MCQDKIEHDTYTKQLYECYVLSYRSLIYNYVPVSIKVKDFLEGADNDSVDARME
jgi:hypothetical protein